MRAALFMAVVAGAMACALGANAQAPGGAEIWDLSAPATPRHWFTGLTCRASAADMPFQQRTAYDVTGGDVSCSYGRSGHPIYVTLYMTMRRPYGSMIDQDVEVARQSIGQRYGRVAFLADGKRTLSTPQGDVAVHEIVLRMGGQDSIQQRNVSGITGAWLADVGGWTLKLRLTGGSNENLAWARATADQLLTQTLADLDTARACAGAGAEAPPAARLGEDAALQLGIAAAMLLQVQKASLPADAAAARAAGFVCLGDAAQTNDGVIATAVLPKPDTIVMGADGALLALGEIRGRAGPMAAILAVPGSLFDIAGAPAKPMHVLLSYSSEAVGYWRIADQTPRLAAAHGAASIAAGASPVLSMGQSEDK